VFPEGDQGRAHRARASSRSAKAPTKQMALTAILRLPEQAPGYIFGAFIFTYGTQVLGVTRNFLLLSVLVGAVLRQPFLELMV